MRSRPVQDFRLPRPLIVQVADPSTAIVVPGVALVAALVNIRTLSVAATLVFVIVSTFLAETTKPCGGAVIVPQPAETLIEVQRLVKFPL